MLTHTPALSWRATSWKKMPAQASTPSWKNVRHPGTSHHEKTSPCHLGLDKSTANHVALPPLSFLQRAAAVHPDRIAVIDGERQWTWAQPCARCRRPSSRSERTG